jgi:hypothetical protein
MPKKKRREPRITIDGVEFAYEGEEPALVVDVEYTADVCHSLMGCDEAWHESRLTIDHLKAVMASENAASASKGRYKGARLAGDSLGEGTKLVYATDNGTVYLRATLTETGEWTLKHA